MPEDNKEKETLKVLRVSALPHQSAKINAARKGLKLQIYIESLIAKDEAGKVDWG